MIKTEWHLMVDKQPEFGEEIYISSIYDNNIMLGVWYINEVDGKDYPQALHSGSTPTSIEYIKYWSYSLKELLK